MEVGYFASDSPGPPGHATPEFIPPGEPINAFEPIGVDADGKVLPPTRKVPVDRPWNRSKWAKLKGKRKAAAKSRARNR